MSPSCTVPPTTEQNLCDSAMLISPFIHGRLCTTLLLNNKGNEQMNYKDGTDTFSK